MKISIIVPIYNVEKCLERCIDSLLNQDFKNYEILLINDGSPDNSQRIIDKYVNKYSNVKGFLKKNGGLSDARNYGLKKAKGKYVLFVDSDDFIEKNCLSKLYKIANDSDLDVLIGNYKTIENGNIKENINLMNENVTDGNTFVKTYFCLKNSPIMAWLFLCKKDYLMNNNLYFKKGIYHEDEELMPRVILNAKKIRYVNYTYYNYVITDNSITQKKDKTKNINDIYEFTDELYSIYSKTDDDITRKILLDRLVRVRLLAFCMSNKFEKKFVFPRKKIMGKSYSLRNKIKSFIYCLSPRLYFKLNKIKNKN